MGSYCSPPLSAKFSDELLHCGRLQFISPKLAFSNSNTGIAQLRPSRRESARRVQWARTLKGREHAKCQRLSDLASADDVDLVVCAVRVDRHFETISPALKAGKNVLVEWPLGRNLAEAEELVRLSREHGVRIAAVGCQGRFDTGIRTLKDILAKQRLGKILSTTVTGVGATGGPTLDATYAYLGQIEIGGNMMTIPFGHFMDSFVQGRQHLKAVSFAG